MEVSADMIPAPVIALPVWRLELEVEEELELAASTKQSTEEHTAARRTCFRRYMAAEDLGIRK